MNYGDSSNQNGYVPHSNPNMQIQHPPNSFGMTSNSNSLAYDNRISSHQPMHCPPAQQSVSQFNQPMHHNPRKCSTIVTPDQLRQQQMMPPPSIQRPQSIQVSGQHQHSPHTLQSPIGNVNSGFMSSSPQQQSANLMHSPQQQMSQFPQMQTSPNMNSNYQQTQQFSNQRSTAHPYVGLQDCSPPSAQQTRPSAYPLNSMQSTQYESNGPMYNHRTQSQMPSTNLQTHSMTTNSGVDGLTQNSSFPPQITNQQPPMQLNSSVNSNMKSDYSASMNDPTSYCNSNAVSSNDFYLRSAANYQNPTNQPHSWRKASLACNFRLNPITRKDSTSPKSCIENSQTHQQLQQPSPNVNGMTRSFGKENENEPPITRKLSYHPQNSSSSYNDRNTFSNKISGGGFNEKYRSQSLSAAEFLRRQGSIDGSRNGKGIVPSLRRYNSQLRTHRFSTAGLPFNSTASPYTPPPMLSPLRLGTGLYRSISRQERKISSLALKGMSGTEEAQPTTSTEDRTETSNKNELKMESTALAMNSTSPIALNGPKKSISTVDEPHTSVVPNERKHSGRGLISSTYPIDIEQARATLTGRKPFIRPPMDNRVNAPQRKNGLFLSGAVQGTDGSAFAAELEALRKESASSTASTNQETNPSRRMSIIRNSKLSNAMQNDDDLLRKLSQTSPPIVEDEPTRKLSSTSDTYYDFVGIDSDITPHINLGKPFQARVKKWSERKITKEERDAIPDRDDMVFDCRVIEHIPARAVAAYEALACSQAVPRPGRNKELALHILMENQGNMQASVMDLLRSDTLDWEQYPIIFNNLYVDVDNWTPEEVASFQDAIYKSEKDFHQVAAELGNRTVKQCVAFYYTWKKCCPDDYRKLRNLRRKRLLLEQQIDYTTFEAARQRTQSENPAESSDDDYSDGGIESDATSVASLSHFHRQNSPYEDTRGEKYPRLALQSPMNVRKISATVRFGSGEPVGLGTSGTNDDQIQHPMINAMNNISSSMSGASAYPWLHGGEFPSPASSATSVNNSYSQPPSVGSMAMDIFGNDSNSGSQNPPAKPKRPNGKKGAQPAADGFFHCHQCEKKFEKVKSLNAHQKSHAMKARAQAEAAAQLQHKQQQQSGFNQQQRNRLENSNSNEDRTLNESLLPLGFRTDLDAQLQQQNQQQAQQAAFLRLFGAHNAFSAASNSNVGTNDPTVSMAMSQLTVAQQLSAAAAFAQQPELTSVLAAMPTTQPSQTTAATLEQLHLQNLQHSATIMH
ncbi:hypothetical protein M3Y94_00213500 [Aphelenchoides besseyi]|nr:hypothetical protein M3Y94_00213500 [Aphelenchoides besseyi]KAI6236600.1 hypothetical protein M3Y95_00174900 [Aphelenchoides besseyi]